MYLEALGILLSVIAIALMIRKGFKLLWALLVGVAFIPIFSQMHPMEIINIIKNTVVNPVTILLVLMVTAISIMGYVLDKTGIMHDMVESLYHLINDTRILLVLLPAMVSFLSIPGGAIISAPMVDEASKKMQISKTKQCMANLLFRHLFVLISPFYPAIIVISGVTGVNMFRFILFNIPVFIVGVALSSYYLFKGISVPESITETESVATRLFRLVLNFLPFIIILIFYLALGLYLPISLFLGVIAALFLNIPQKEKLHKVLLQRSQYLWKGISWSMIATIFTIMLYKEFIENTDSLNIGVTIILSRGFPLVILLIAIPYITGLMTGNNAASLGVALPILMPVLNPAVSSISQLGLIFVSSFVGYLGSPIHFCTYLTNEYFKTPLGKVVFRLNVMGMIFILTALVTSLLIS